MKRKKKSRSDVAYYFFRDSRGGVRWVLLVKKHVVRHQFEWKTAARLSIAELLDKIMTDDNNPRSGTFQCYSGKA